MDRYRDALERVIVEDVRPQAGHIDAAAEFPRRSIDALGKGGLLGLTVAETLGGGGGGLAEAAEVVGALAAACGSTAMVVLMHYAATAVIEASRARRRSARRSAPGEHLTTLAFSEAGSRSHFWAPLGTATADGDAVRLDAHKSWVTAAGEADSYVWSSRPLDGRRADDAVAGALATPPGLTSPGRSTARACGATRPAR